MAKRAAVCIGVDRAGSMTPLRAAAVGAREFEAWAQEQGCDTVLLVDEGQRRIGVSDVFDAVLPFVEAATYEQLIVYFSGHGILTAPGAEFWLLSRAPQNPNDAVNLSRSIVEARNSGIPHVVFVSDACRSAVAGPPLSGVLGGVIFPSRPFAARQGEVDVYYATRPGDPAYEVPEAEATTRFRGIFTDALLGSVRSPQPVMIEPLQGTGPVVSSRRLKDYLEATVPEHASDVDFRLRQVPQVIVETALPKYFARVIAASGGTADFRGPAPSGALSSMPPAPTVDDALSELRARYMVAPAAVARAPIAPPPAAPPVPPPAATDRFGLREAVDSIAARRGRDHFETTTGFTVYGTGRPLGYARAWHCDEAFPAGGDGAAWHLRLERGPHAVDSGGASVVIRFGDRSGTVLPVYPGFIGTVIVERDRVVSVTYVPSAQTPRYGRYRAGEDALNDARAFVAVAARQGRLELPAEGIDAWLARLCGDAGIDPVLGLYAAYACVLAGSHAEFARVLDRFAAEPPEVPIPFDIGMLAARMAPGAARIGRERLAPFCPMLAQGWVHLVDDDPLATAVVRELRSHLIPALWTTLDASGLEIVRGAIDDGRVR